VKSGTVRIIGLTGGIASGKSTVARFFQDRGAVVIDADELARKAVEPGSQGLKEVLAAFGADFITHDGQLERKRLADVIFADPDRRSVLESILHPEIKRLAENRIREAVADGCHVVFYMAPLLIEAGATDRVDEIWVVTVSPEVQLERLMVREGLSRADALRITSSQMPLAEKARHGRIVIDNSGTPEETARLLAAIWAEEIEGKP
jgi:dephospho-CoA kinase